MRNIIFRILQIWDRNSSMKYCLSNAAAQVVTELVNTMQNVRRGSLLIPTLGQIGSTPSNNELLEVILRDLKEGGNLVVPCEQTDEKSFSPRAVMKQQTFLDWDDIDHDKSFNASIVRFINPQVNFEVVGTTTGKNYVLMAAKSLDLKFIREIDSEKQFIEIYQTQQDRIIMFRNSWAVTETQFLIQKVDATATTKTEKVLPWVPLECLLDSKLEDEQFVRVIDKADVIFRSDKENPLYINRKQRVRESKEEVYPNAYYLKIPTVKLSAGSKEYLILSDWFTNLLYYRDARSGESSEKAKKMLLTLEQSGELNSFKLLVLSLQDQIKQIDYLVQYDPTQKTKDALDQLVQARTHLKEDLYILIEGLKNLMQVSTKRRSVKADWKLTIKVEDFTWLLLQVTKVPFCRWGMSGIKVLFYLNQFVSVNNEDLSSKNTLIINTAEVENLTGAKMKSVLSTYYPDSILDSDKFMRVFWHENAPVAGIKVVDHFEVNLHPLMIQMTYDFGKEMAHYMFPNRFQRKASKKTPISPSSPEADDDTLKSPESGQLNMFDDNNQILEMQLRAERNRSFIYIKVPGIQHCISYKGPKETNFEDLQNFVVQLPTLEYRNRTWSWYDFLNALKKDALRAALANTGSLLKEKLFVRKPVTMEAGPKSPEHTSENSESEKKPKTTTASLLKASLQRKFSGRRKETSFDNGSRTSIASIHVSNESIAASSSSGNDDADSEILRKGQMLLGKQFSLYYGPGLGV